MEGHNIPVHPPVMVSPTPLAQNFLPQPIGISSQELQSLLAKPAKELPVQVSTQQSTDELHLTTSRGVYILTLTGASKGISHWGGEFDQKRRVKGI